jgi:hypothetical protein
VLERERREREDGAARATAEVRAAADAAARPRALRSIGETGIVVVATRRDRVGVLAAEPWVFAKMLWDSPREIFWGCIRPLALHMPRFDVDGVRSLAADDLAPATMLAAPEPDPSAIAFLQARRLDSSLFNFGPVPTFTADVPDVAREIARAYAPWNPLSPWRQVWAIEVLVRSLGLRPDVACALLLECLDERFKRQNPGYRVPVGPMHNTFDGSFVPRPDGAFRTVGGVADKDLPSRTAGRELAALCVEAARRGQYVGAGEPLDELPPVAKSSAKVRP